jgi:hypothetical protein
MVIHLNVGAINHIGVVIHLPRIAMYLNCMVIHVIVSLLYTNTLWPYTLGVKGYTRYCTLAIHQHVMVIYPQG